MTDKELLELAAKAGCVELDHFNDLKNAYWIDSEDRWWNPLTDDGDALRLAVRLDLQVGQGWAGTLSGSVMQSGTNESNPYAATRRAIVRAAAEIGKSL